MSADLIDLNAGETVYSPDYFPPVGGGDIFPVAEQPLSFPQVDPGLNDALPCIPSGSYGPPAVNQSYCPQDGTTGDSTDTSGLWSTIGGVAGTFLRSFTGGQGVTIGANMGSSVPTAPKPPAVSNNTVMYVAFGVILLFVFMLLQRK